MMLSLRGAAGVLREPFYITQFAYTPEAWTALVQNPEGRSNAVRGLAESLGGRLISYYFGFGEYDGVIIAEAPNETTAILMVAATPVPLKAIKTTVLLSAVEGMEAMRKAGEVAFQAPGG